MAIVKPIPEQEDIDWRQHCAACQRTDGVIMVPQLNDCDHLVAYIIICSYCRKDLDHTMIEVVLKEDAGPRSYREAIDKGVPFKP